MCVCGYGYEATGINSDMQIHMHVWQYICDGRAPSRCISKILYALLSYVRFRECICMKYTLDIVLLIDKRRTFLCTHHIWCRFMLHPGASRLCKLRHQFIFEARRSPSVERTVRKVLASLLCMFCVFMNCRKCGQSLISEFEGHTWWWVKSSRKILLLFLKCSSMCVYIWALGSVWDTCILWGETVCHTFAFNYIMYTICILQSRISGTILRSDHYKLMKVKDVAHNTFQSARRRTHMFQAMVFAGLFEILPEVDCYSIWICCRVCIYVCVCVCVCLSMIETHTQLSHLMNATWTTPWFRRGYKDLWYSNRDGARKRG